MRHHVRYALHVSAGWLLMAGSPSWAGIAATIRARIADGTYPAEGLLPSTMALSVEFGVSQGPIQRAVAALKAEGLAVGEQGRGVRVVGTLGAGPGTVEDRLAALEAWQRRHEAEHRDD
jgi:DNA-binding GntR family transcriptional regulator